MISHHNVLTTRPDEILGTPFEHFGRTNERLPLSAFFLLACFFSVSMAFQRCALASICISYPHLPYSRVHEAFDFSLAPLFSPWSEDPKELARNEEPAMTHTNAHDGRWTMITRRQEEGSS